MRDDLAKEKHRAYCRTYRVKNRAKIRLATNSWRSKNPDKVRAQKARYQRIRILTDEQSLKVKARKQLNAYYRDRKLQRPSCEVCGVSKTDAHHQDYTKPLDVRWLCRKHHQKLHSAVVAGRFN